MAVKVVLVGATPAEHAGDRGRTWDGRKDCAYSSYNYAIGLLRACALADEQAARETDVALVDVAVGRTQRRLRDDEMEAIARERPEVVGMSCACWSVDLFEETAKALRESLPRARFVAGGPAAGPRAEERLAASGAFDAIVRGEGERAFVELCRRGFRGFDRVPDVTWRDGDRIVANAPSPDPVDLAALPSPYLSGAFAPRAAALLVEPSRGCRRRCSFCAWAMRGGGVRHVPQDRIAAELAWAVRRGFGAANLCDTAINHSTRELRDLCDAVGRGDPSGALRCSTFIRHEELDDEQIAVLAARPFAEIILGVESIDPAALRSAGKAPLDPAALERAIEAIGRGGSRVTVSLISGLPGDTVEGFGRTLDWAEALLRRLPEVVSTVCCFWLAVLPGTRLEARAVEYGFRTARRGTPYVTSSRDFTSADMVRMSRMLVDRGARAPRLCCEEVHRVAAGSRDGADLEAVLLADRDAGRDG